MKNRHFLAAALLLVVTAGCSSTYYSAMEKLGYAKRDLLISRVEDANSTQIETKEQFKSALAQFSAVLNFHGGKLQDKYEALDAEFTRSEKRAKELHKRIESVENVAEALFDEWEDELDAYKSASLRSSSAAKLKQTRERYKPMIAAMKRAEKKIDPVLDAFRDQVLFLKHNLNAQAVASLQDEYGSLDSDIDALVAEMEKSINEASEFVSSMNASA